MSKTRVVRIKPTCFAGTTKSNNSILFNPTEIPGSVFGIGGASVIKSIMIVDYDNNISKDTHLFFFQRGGADLGPLGKAVNIIKSDLSKSEVLAMLSVPGVRSTDMGAFSNAKLSNISKLGVGVKAKYGSSCIYVAAISKSSGTVSTVDGRELIITFGPA